MTLEQLLHEVPPHQLSDLLMLTFTEKELQMVRERWAIFAGFREGLSQREIAARLGCGIATVTRGARAYRQYKPLIDQMLERCTPTD